jgi:predicted dehydrogenase
VDGASVNGASDRLRVGVIGCGVGLFHLEGYAAEPRAKVVALAGLDTERCRGLARQFDVEAVYGDYSELLADPTIDAVSVGVPNHLHLPVCLAALEAGKHVLVEKPLARNAEEGGRMVQAARERGKVLAIAFNRRHRHDVALLKQHIAAGKLGRIYYAKAFWMRRAGIPGFGSWFTRQELAGGGPLIDLGVHVLDMALYLMGNPRVLSVSAATYAELGPRGRGAWSGSRFKNDVAQPYEVEDLATAFIRLKDGATLHLETCWAAYTGVTDEFGVSLFGNEGGAEIHVKDYALTDTLRVFGDFEGVPSDAMPRLQKTHGHTEIIHSFVDAILTGAPMSPSGDEGLERTRLIDAIYRSAALSREVELAAVSDQPSALAAAGA